MSEMPKMKAVAFSNVIVIDKDSFEHLLNCLDNQKFINDVNADGWSEGEESVKNTQKETQDFIDDFNMQCRKLLHSKS